MSNKDLQRVTESVSYIGQAVLRRSLPARRNHITQRIRIAVEPMLYLSVHDDGQLAEIFLRLKGPNCSDLIGRHLLVECCGRHELAHVSLLANSKEAS